MYNDIESIKTLANNNLYLTSAKVDNPAFDYKSGNAEVETVALNEAEQGKYLDVKGNNSDAADYVTEKGYMLGLNEENFNPDGKVTRAYMTQVLYNMAGRPQVGATSQYSDVSSSAWYSNAVTWATENGIATGTDGKYNPGEELTNEEALTMLRQYADYRDLDVNAYVNLDKFSDASSVSPWARDTMSWAVDNWVYKGDTLNPQASVTRGDLASYIQGFETTYANDLAFREKRDLANVDLRKSTYANIPTIKSIDDNVSTSDTGSLSISHINTPSGPGTPPSNQYGTLDLGTVSDSHVNTPSGPGTPPSNQYGTVEEYDVNNEATVPSQAVTETPKTTVTTSKFKDVTQKDMEAVNYVSERGLMVGTTDTTFNPNGNVTRAQIVQTLYAMSGSPKNIGSGATFSDVKSGDWYSNAVTWAKNTNLVAGYDDGTFRPDQVLTKEQAAAIFRRYAEQSGHDLTTYKTISNPVMYNTLRDTNDVSDYAKDAVRWAVADGMIDTSSGAINPKANVTRAELARYLMTYDINYNNSTGKGNYNVAPTYVAPTTGVTPSANTGATQTTPSGSVNLLDGSYWLDLLKKFPTSYNKESTKGIRNDPTFVKDPETGLYPNGTKSGVKWLDYDSSWSDKFNADMAGANSSISAGKASASAAANNFNQVANSGLSNNITFMNNQPKKSEKTGGTQSTIGDLLGNFISADSPFMRAAAGNPINNSDKPSEQFDNIQNVINKYFN